MSKITGYDTHDDGPGFVGIRFCQECNNMLYPKEDKENKVLMYAVSIIVIILSNQKFLFYYLINYKNIFFNNIIMTYIIIMI
jgi:hypothetical protein